MADHEDPGRLTAKFLMGRGRDRLSADDIDALEKSAQEVTTRPARQMLTRAGEPVSTSTMLLEGFVCRYMDDRDGLRQLVSLHVPGDFVDLHGFPLKRLDHDVATLGPVRIANWSHASLERLTAERPRLTRALWFSTLLDAAMHREWIFRLGRLGAEGRVAHLFCELEARLAMVGLAHDGRFQLPMTQADLGEACGLTGVHVNRVLRSLRERGLLIFRNNEAELIDRRALAALAEFQPGYLFPDGSTHKKD